jgi:adenylate cyclase
MTDLVQQYRGRVVDTTGDNILAEFTSVVDAVNCAVEIQRELAEQNAELPYNRKMEFRIGINLGDVIEEEGRIYGDGVNIAARVEAMSKAGGICISGRAYDQVENKLGLEYENLGEHQVKNITNPIPLYPLLSFPGPAARRVILAKVILRKKLLWVTASTIVLLLIIFLGLFWKYYYLPAPAEIDPEDNMTFDLSKGPSIAVLPFVNMSKEPDQEYFCDGITENTIFALSHFPQLLVIARNSTFFYKGKSVKVQQIGYELGAQYVIEGSIQKSDEQIRITVQLIDTKSGHHMWSEQYDRELKDIFKLQDEITLAIAKAIGINLINGEQTKTRYDGVTDLSTFIKAIKAVEYFRQYTKESNILAQKSIEELIELVPEHSGGYTLLGITLLAGIEIGTCESDLICFGRATEAARKALSLDGNNSDAHLLASYLFAMRKEYEKAISEAKRAITLNPNNSDAYDVLGWILIISDQPIRAIEFSKKAIRLNPIPPAVYFFHLAWAYRDSEQYEKAIETYKKCLEYQPDFVYAYLHLAATYSIIGNEKEAKSAALEVLNLDPNYSLEQHAKKSTYKSQAKRERYFNALRKAGLN